MSNLPTRRHEAVLSRIDLETCQDLQRIRGGALREAAAVQAIGYVTEIAEKEALSIAMAEALCSRVAPHAADRFRVIAEAGTQALVLKVMQQGR
jgi:hypothetical protein